MSHPDSAARAELLNKYRMHDKDSGSPEVQVALLTRRLEILSEHFKNHGKDLHSQRGMQKIISRRKEVLAYLRRENIERYKNLITALGLRK